MSKSQTSYTDETTLAPGAGKWVFDNYNYLHDKYKLQYLEGLEISCVHL